MAGQLSEPSMPVGVAAHLRHAIPHDDADDLFGASALLHKDRLRACGTQSQEHVATIVHRPRRKRPVSRAAGAPA